MLFKIGLIKQISEDRSIKLFLNVESKSVEDAIKQALTLAKNHDAELEFIDQLVEGHVDISEGKLLEVIEKYKPKVKGGSIYG